MAVTTMDEARNAGRLRLALPLVVGAVIFLVILAVGRNLLNDPDSYWHLTVGDWILAHGFPHTDPFSFTFAGKPWIAKEWLSQILYAGAWHLAGWSGVALLAAAALALAFALMAGFLERELAPVPVLAFLALAFMIAAPHMVARPHALALPVMVAFAGGLARAMDRKTGALLLAAAADGAVGEPPWRLHPRLRARRRRRPRRAGLGRRESAARHRPRLAALRRAAAHRRHGHALRAAIDARHLAHPPSRTGAVDHLRMAAARLRPSRRLRGDAAPRARLRPLSRLHPAAGAHPHPPRAAAPGALGEPQQRAPRHASPALPRRSPGASVRRSQRPAGRHRIGAETDRADRRVASPSSSCPPPGS